MVCEDENTQILSIFCIDRALVLANKAKEEQAMKRNDPSKLALGPRNRVSETDGPVNADGKFCAACTSCDTPFILD